MPHSVHVFAGTFTDRESACKYSEAQWEPEPDDSVSDEDYAAWQNRNPLWQLRSDLGIYVDSDFVETIDGDHRFEYLKRMLTEKGAIDRICAQVSKAENILVLIFSMAFRDSLVNLKSTRQLKYCGEFECNFSDGAE